MDTMSEKKSNPEESPKIKVEDKRFWVRKETGAKKDGEKPPRKSDYPTVVEQLQLQMEASRDKLKERLDELDKDKSAFRKRISGELEKRFELERLRLVEILLDVLDNLEKALDSDVEDRDNWLKGVRVIRDDVWLKLRGLDIEKIDTKGKPFDPEIHEAVMTRETNPPDDGMVLEEVRTGYRAGERIVRPAKVVVGKSKE